MAGASEVFTILVVCTGNVCRSPLAERLLRARLADRLGPAARQVRVHSAGTAALAGHPMDPSAGSSCGPWAVTTRDSSLALYRRAPSRRAVSPL